MSKFKTSIPIEIDLVKKSLPEGSHIDAIKFDEAAGAVEIHWQHDKFRTPFDHATEFPRLNLETFKVPAGVKLIKDNKPAPAAPRVECPHAENCGCPECQANKPAPTPIPEPAPTPIPEPAAAPIEGQTEGPVTETPQPVTTAPETTAQPPAPEPTAAPSEQASAPKEAAPDDVRTQKQKRVESPRRRR